MKEQQQERDAKISMIRINPNSFKISQEDIICEGQKTETLLQSVVCPVCLMLLPIPHYVCESCDNAFCVSCLSNWWSKQPNTCIFKCQNASFKTVKRSNTYNALMDLLKTKCKHCKDIVPINSYQNHDKICPKKIVFCQIQGCGKEMHRQQLDKHSQNCEYRIANCKYCQKALRMGQLFNHQNNQCKVRQISCKNKQCNEKIKANLYDQHIKNCSWNVKECIWCHQTIYAKQKMLHDSICMSREYQCKWCKLSYKKQLYEKHEQICDEIQELCKLCNQSHRLGCMFENMVQMKINQNTLFQENIKLKMKIHQLQNQLQETQKNRCEGAFEALIKIKKDQRQQYEKDLLRLNNGIQNLQKLRNNQMYEHMKKPHISSSLCPFCISIRNKLEQEIAPLNKKREQVTFKIRELDRMSQGIQKTAKKSMIRD